MLAEIRDYRFRLGNVHKNSYREIFLSHALKSTLPASCVETLPGCSECAFQPYCGADPVYNHTTQGDTFGHRPTSEFHKRNFGIMKLLFRKMFDDPDARKIFLGWVIDESGTKLRPEPALA
jgi:radical SAM protein with 4Fe4S-binding SPASM domain